VSKFNKILEGKFDKNLQLNGYGRQILPNGTYYEGYFKDGVYSGEGKLVYLNGTVNQGIFENGELVQPK